MPQLAHPLLSAQAITMRFGAVTALSDVAVELTAGKVRAIVGENGAGKSTLAKILAGIYPPDTGTVLWNGEPVTLSDRRAARDLGIAFVPQNLSFIGTLTLVENHMLAQAGWRLDRDATRAALQAAAAEVSLDIETDRPIETLGLAQRQLGEIVSAIAAGSKVLLLDEPTSALGPREIEALIATMRTLAKKGQAIGLVTHRIEEVMQGADTVTVLRGGELVFDGETAGLDGDSIARLMVGDRNRDRVRLGEIQTDWKRLMVEHLRVERDGQMLIEDIGFTVRQGEILGVAGVSGPMQPALAEALAGLVTPVSGSIKVDGVNIAGQPARARKAGLAYVPEDRTRGVVGGLSTAENASLFRIGQKAMSRFGLLRDRQAETELGADIIRRFDVRPPDPSLDTGGLSGGNQQKLLVGRELNDDPAVVIAHGPAKGLDLSAAAAIRTALVDVAAKGAAVVVISADLDELMEICHRLVVLAGRRISGVFDLSEPLDMGRLGQAMADAAPLETA